MQPRILKALAVSLFIFSPTEPDGFGQGTPPDLSFSSLRDVALDAQGDILVVDHDSNRVYKVTRDGNISVFAGTGQLRDSRNSGGDGGPATEARLSYPNGIAIGSRNEVYISDSDLIRRVDSSGIITTFAGGGESDGSIPYGQPAIDFGLFDARTIEYDPRSERLYIWQSDQRIWRVENGRIFHQAGSGEIGCGGDGGTPTEAQFDYIKDMAVGPDGSLYLADNSDLRIRKIDPAGSTITTVVGNGRLGGDRIPYGTPALKTGIRYPEGLAFDSRGLLHFIDDVGIIYRLEPNQTLTLFSDLSDLPGGKATGSMVFGSAGNLIIADQNQLRILEVSADGSRVRTIAGGSKSRESQEISDVSPVATPGVHRNKTTPRDSHSIVGGEEVTAGEWPMVLRVDTPTKFCTASLVAPNWVLTAAHCLVDHDGSVDDPNDISVFLGHDWNRGVCENTRDEIGRVIIHPDYYYKGAGFRNDAALVEILEPAPATPVRILTPEEEAWHAPSGTKGTAVGWGRTDDGGYPRILRQVGVPVWSPEDCLRDTLWRNREIVHDRTLCAGSEGMGIDSGDSGGPLLVGLPDGDWVQVGILSQGRRVRRGYPAVYTRTSAIYDWIHQHIAGGVQFSRLDAGQVLTTERSRTVFLAGDRFEETDPAGSVRTGSYAFQSHGPRTGTLTLTYDDDTSCTFQLTFTSATAGTSSYRCSDGRSGSESFQLTSGDTSLFVPVLLTAAGRNNAFFTSELTLTNRGTEEATLHFGYTADAGGGSGTAADTLAPGRQRIQPNAIDYLTGLGIPIPDSGNRVGTLRVEVTGSSEVSLTTRTSTVVPDGRAGLSYPSIAEDEGFQEAVYLCGLRQNAQDRSNVAFQHMGSSDKGPITLRTTVYSGEADDTGTLVVGEVELKPGGFHQYSGLLGRLGSPAQGYVKVEKVSGDAPFYAYGVINDNFNSDGSFVFPLTESSLVGTTGQTLPVIIETGNFQSELTVTNFSATDRQVDFSFVADGVDRGDDTATFSLRLKAGEQQILPDLVNWLRQQEVAGIGQARRAYVGALFATPVEGDLSGIVIGARTGAPDKRGGQYSLFYNGVPYGGASVESAWIYGLQQNAENRSNLALVNTGEIDDSPSTFEITVYDGSGESEPTTRSVTLGPRRWTQENGILGSISQGYVQVRKTSGNNPFITYGVINDGGRPGERSGDGAFLLSQE
ncbi:MAG: trypsin-like serine protease [Acidobacteria bacterium]|nr:trypsin-like serine protease [Acidobacteriota bacterium]